MKREEGAEGMNRIEDLITALQKKEDERNKNTVAKYLGDYFVSQ